MFSSKLGKPLQGGEQAGVEGGNNLKSISETEPGCQLLNKTSSQTLVYATPKGWTSKKLHQTIRVGSLSY